MRILLFIILLSTVSCRTYNSIFRNIVYYYPPNPSLADLLNKEKEDFAKRNVDTFLLIHTDLGNCFGPSLVGDAKVYSIKNGKESCYLLKCEQSGRHNLYKSKITKTAASQCNLMDIINLYEQNHINIDTSHLKGAFQMDPETRTYLYFQIGNQTYRDSLIYFDYSTAKDTLSNKYRFYKMIFTNS